MRWPRGRPGPSDTRRLVCSAPAIKITGLVRHYRRTTAVAGLPVRAERSQVTHPPAGVERAQTNTGPMAGIV